MLIHLVQEIDHHDNVPDPRTVAPRDPCADDLSELVEDLSFRYEWFGYPTIETRILQHAFANGIEGLPTGRTANLWTAAEMAAATAACERYVREHPLDPPPFPPRQPRPYDADATADDVAAFARACESLRLVPEDVLVLALHTLCAADVPAMPCALHTLGLVFADIESHGNVRDPVAATGPPAVVH